MKEVKHQIILNFGDKQTIDWINTVCKRKGYTLEEYIIDNFEWDEMPDCLQIEAPKKITSKVCDGCDFYDNCPDAIGDE